MFYRKSIIGKSLHLFKGQQYDERAERQGLGPCCIFTHISYYGWIKKNITFLGMLELLRPEEDRLFAGFLNWKVSFC